MPLFTRESAVLAGRKSAALAKQRRELAKLNPPPPKPTTTLEPLTLVPATDSHPSTSLYVSLRLTRTRSQIDLLTNRLDSLLEAKVLDSRAIKEACDSLTRLSELEQTLANRPKPGTWRPEGPKASRSAAHYPQPQPIAIAEPTPLTTNDNALSYSPTPPSDQPPTDPS